MKKYKIYTNNGIILSSDGYINTSSYFKHNENGPAYIVYQNHEIVFESYYVNNKLHREDGPAVINYSINGGLYYEMYCIDGNIHREDGPAHISKLNGNTIHKFYINNKLHRTDGPAIIEYDNDNNIIHEYFYIYNKSLTKHQFIFNNL